MNIYGLILYIISKIYFHINNNEIKTYSILSIYLNMSIISAQISEFYTNTNF